MLLLPRALPAASPEARSAVTHDAKFELLRLASPQAPRVFFADSVFRMGSTREEIELSHAECAKEVHGGLCETKDFQNEAPVRRVQLSAFHFDRHEVSVAQYERCVAVQRCTAVPYYKGAQRFRRPDYPVSLVTWNEAQDYCRFMGGQLPTEAQWERAARGLQTRRYPWGNLYHSQRSNHGRLQWDQTDGSDGHVELAAVGSYPSGATPEGVLDLAGNVEEWVHDAYEAEYDPTDVVDPEGPSSGGAEVARSVRGGSYTSPAVRLRGASRTQKWPGTRDPSRGFRCAQSSQAWPR